jgi:hypothetical protein
VASPGGSARPTVDSTPAAAGPARPPDVVVSWPPDLAARLQCTAAVQAPTPDASGSGPYQNVAEPTIELAFDRFLRVDGQTIGYLPLAGWSKRDGGTGWGRFEHIVAGRTKAIALFAALPEGPDTRWSWAVAACDPSEFDPGVAITGHVVIWTDGTGARVPTARVLERGLCGVPAVTISVDGRVFADSASTYGERMMTTYAAHVPLPADAKATPYRNGERRIWLAADAKAAYVGTPTDVARWPRLLNDDDSVTDCN